MHHAISTDILVTSINFFNDLLEIYLTVIQSRMENKLLYIFFFILTNDNLYFYYNFAFEKKVLLRLNHEIGLFIKYFSNTLTIIAKILLRI